MQNILKRPCRAFFKLYEGSAGPVVLNSFPASTHNIFGFIPSRNFCITSVALVRPSIALHMAEVPRMRQVEVDELDVQKKLGKINMDFVRKAEKRNKERASMHRFFRRKDWLIAVFCFSIVIGIYSYTIWAIQQEKFLDDFEMPDEIDHTQKK